MKLTRKSPGLLYGGYYFPTGIFAVLSLVSFSIELQNVPGRLGLLVTLYLIMTNVYISVEGKINFFCPFLIQIIFPKNKISTCNSV